MKKHPLPLLLLLAFAQQIFSQKPAIIQRPQARANTFQPKLVVGIVVDQMRYDYLYRFREKYGEGGLRRLLREGFSCENTNYNYVPTYTGPGHAAIYTGTTPSLNGVISNDWYDPEWRRMRYVTADTTVRAVHAPAANKAGQQSPRVMLSTTVTDELRLSNNFQSKVVGVCLKDRGSILPAGHIPNACYWFDDESGNWITSTFYKPYAGMDWVDKFNERRLPEQYLTGKWATQLPENQYTESFQDWEKFEKKLKGNDSGKFPYDLPTLKSKGGLGIIRYTPFGNTLTLDFAIEAIEKMELGADSIPDFLALSFSSTDYCGHQFGIHSQETEDVYLRLDRDLERLLTFLDKKIGRENVLIFLTADHGGGETPVHLQEIGIPAGVLEESKLQSELDSLISKKYVAGKYVLEVGSQQVWLDAAALDAAGIEKSAAEQLIVKHLRSKTGIYDAHSRTDLMALPADYPFAAEVRRGIFPRRSGDVFFLLDPAWHPDDSWFKTAGATHGSPFAYDTHVPLIWYGWKIRRGETFAPVSITDIAPTLSALLKIARPNATTGQVIQEILK